MDKSMESRNHHYILEPVCASALLKRNCSKEPLRSRHSPRVECDIQLETIPLKLSQVLTCPGGFCAPRWMHGQAEGSMLIGGSRDFTVPGGEESARRPRSW